MRHACLPEKMTAEQLGDWINSNHKRTVDHITRTPLTPQEIADLEHKSSLASRAIDRLQEVLDECKHYIKKGTEYDGTTEQYLPKDITVPPSKGMDALKANREAADSTLEIGHNVETTVIYVIPYPEAKSMVGVDIEGTEWPDYTKPMTKPEEELYGNLFYKDKEGNLQQLEIGDMDVDRHEGTAKIKVPKKKKGIEEGPFV